MRGGQLDAAAIVAVEPSMPKSVYSLGRSRLPLCVDAVGVGTNSRPALQGYASAPEPQSTCMGAREHEKRSVPSRRICGHGKGHVSGLGTICDIVVLLLI